MFFFRSNLVAYNVLSGWSDLYFLSVVCECVCLMPSLNLLSAGYGAVSQSSGGDVAFRPFGLLNLFPVFPCDMVVGTFFMSFLGGKYFLRKKSWCMRLQHCGYQATDKGKARKVS